MRTLREKRSFMYAGRTEILWKPAPRAAEFYGATTVAAPKTDSALVEWIGMLRGLRLRRRSARRSCAMRSTRAPDRCGRRPTVLILWRPAWPRRCATISRLTSSASMRRGSARSRRRTSRPPRAKYIDVDHLVIVVTGRSQSDRAGIARGEHRAGPRRGRERNTDRAVASASVVLSESEGSCAWPRSFASLRMTLSSRTRSTPGLIGAASRAASQLASRTQPCELASPIVCGSGVP